MRKIKQLEHPDAGAVAPLIAVLSIVFLGVLAPYAARIAGIERAATNTLAFSVAVDRISLAAYTIGRAAINDEAGRLIPPTPENARIPQTVPAIRNDQFGRAYLYCVTAGYSSSAEPLFALVSGGTDHIVETDCPDALVGTARGDDIARTVSVHEASLTPHQVDPRTATLNGMWRSRCVTTGVIQNLADGSKCSGFTDLWTSFISRNGELLP